MPGGKNLNKLLNNKKVLNGKIPFKIELQLFAPFAQTSKIS